MSESFLDALTAGISDDRRLDDFSPDLLALVAERLWKHVAAMAGTGVPNVHEVLAQRLSGDHLLHEIDPGVLTLVFGPLMEHLLAALVAFKAERQAS